MRAGELQRLAQRNEKPNPWTSPNAKVITQRRCRCAPMMFSIAM